MLLESGFAVAGKDIGGMWRGRKENDGRPLALPSREEHDSRLNN